MHGRGLTISGCFKMEAWASSSSCSPCWRDGPGGVLWEASDISKSIGGTLVQAPPPSLALGGGSISTDTRALGDGEWFLPLRGARFDGHGFLGEARRKRCAGVVAECVPPEWDRGFVRVPPGCSTLDALGRLASTVRSRYPGPVVALTGSVGKTTARAMAALALAPLGPVHQTPSNLNNLIGLPLSLLRTPSSSSACVLELGMSHPGEIAALACIAQPSIRLALNVGPSHLENFGSLEDVAAAKGEIFLGAREGDICIVNADDPLIMALPLPLGVNVIFFGKKPGCHMRLLEAEMTQGGLGVRLTLAHSTSFYPSANGGELTRQRGKRFSDAFMELSRKTRGVDSILLREKVEINSPGLHLAINACAAAAVATSLGVPLSSAVKSISAYAPVGKRCSLETLRNGVLVLNDTYNANPVSTAAALRLLMSIDCWGRRRFAFLGDMLELGSLSEHSHAQILHLCEDLKVDFVGVAGPIFSEVARNLNTRCANFLSCLDSTSLALNVKNLPEEGDIVLVKGSRGMMMEILVDMIKAEAAAKTRSPKP